MELKCAVCGRKAEPGVLIGFVHGKFRCGYCIQNMINNLNKSMEKYYDSDNSSDK